jgi:hypothetical protein
MTIAELQTEARRIWPVKMGPSQIAIAMGVVHGDICRGVRDGYEHYWQNIETELGNMIFSTIRWCGDLGFDPEECIRQAIKCQEEFVRERPPW